MSQREKKRVPLVLNKVPDKAVFFVTPVSNSDVDACIELKSYTEDIVNFIKAVDPLSRVRATRHEAPAVDPDVDGSGLEAKTYGETQANDADFSLPFTPAQLDMAHRTHEAMAALIGFASYISVTPQLAIQWSMPGQINDVDLEPSKARQNAMIE